jgi:hypothetical protein
MIDETFPVPGDGAEVAPDASNQTEQAEVTTEPTQSASLSLQDVERLVGEREAKLRAEFDARERKWQSKSDKAYAKALAEAKVIEEHAELLGLEPEQVKAAKQAVINKQFDSAFTQPETDTAPPPPILPDTVGADEIRAWLASNSIVDEELVSKYAGKGRTSQTEWANWDEDVTLAKARSIEQRRLQKEQKQQAAQAAQVKATVGRVNPVPAGGAPAHGYDPVNELEKLMAEGTPDNPAERAKYIARLEKLQKEAGWS